MRARVPASLLWLIPVLLHAHSDIEVQIEALTRRIAQHPADPELYFQRAELYRFHEDWQTALTDYDQAARLNPHLDKIQLARAGTLQEAGRHALAKNALDEFLTRHPQNAEALLVRARARAALKDYPGAIDDYRQSIAAQAQPRPEYYVELAHTHTATGNPTAALEALDAGLNKLGPIPTLETLAIDLELARTNYPGALTRLDQTLTRTTRQEFGLKRRGEILEQAGRPTEAAAAYRQALAALEELPPWRRHIPAIEELATALNQRLQALHARR